MLFFVLFLMSPLCQKGESTISTSELDELFASLSKSQRLCGPIALSYILRSAGRQIDVTEIALKCNNQDSGVKIKELSEVALQYGLGSSVVNIWNKNVAVLPCPSILVIDQIHVVVFLDHNNATVRIYEPSNGKVVTVPLEKLVTVHAPE